jgi:hypothetical protein
MSSAYVSCLQFDTVHRTEQLQLSSDSSFFRAWNHVDANEVVKRILDSVVCFSSFWLGALEGFYIEAMLKMQSVVDPVVFQLCRKICRCVYWIYIYIYYLSIRVMITR